MGIIYTVPVVPIDNRFTSSITLFAVDNYLGPVVQNIVSLTTLIRRQHVKYMPTTFANTLLFFVGKM